MSNNSPPDQASFRATASTRNLKLKRPSVTQRHNHVDYVMWGLDSGQCSYSVSLDIKYRNTKGSDKWHWLEFKNSKGRPGWLYMESDFIVFERKKDYLIVNRKNLVEWTNSTSSIRHDMPRVSNSWQAKYRIYGRPHKHEAITQVQDADLLQIRGTEVWPKVHEKES